MRSGELPGFFFSGDTKGVAGLGDQASSQLASGMIGIWGQGENRIRIVLHTHPRIRA